jgi:hypothetical protein
VGKLLEPNIDSPQIPMKNVLLHGDFLFYPNNR